MFSEEIKQAAQPILHDIQQHPFVQGIQAGKVPRAALAVYVEQDTCFLNAFAKVFAGALVKSQTKERMRFFSEQIQYSLADESAAHQILCDIAGIELAEHQHAEPRPLTALYTEHLFTAVREGDLLDIAAVVLPCPWTYNEISQAIVENAAPDNPFLPWIEFYQGDEEDAGDDSVTQLFAMLDEAAPKLSAQRKEEITHRFLRSCELEYDFWEQAYSQKDWKYRWK